MDSDRDLADLLGEAPREPDPAFRFDVFARVTERARRAVAFNRAVRRILVFAGIGLAVPVAQIALAVVRPDFSAALALSIAAGAVGLAYVAAQATIRGPGILLSYARAALRVRV